MKDLKFKRLDTDLYEATWLYEVSLHDHNGDLTDRKYEPMIVRKYKDGPWIYSVGGKASRFMKVLNEEFYVWRCWECK